MKSLKISIIIPTYNMANFLSQCLVSIIQQNYPNQEIIIIDGGSSDKTFEIVEKFQDYIDVFISEPDNGQSDAVTKGLKLATGDILHWHAADDIVMPGAFDCVSKNFLNNPQVKLIFSDGYAFSDISKKLYTTAPCRWINFERAVLYFARFQSDCAYWRADITSRGLPLDNTKPLTVDEDFFLRIWFNCPHKWVSKRLGAFRMHGNQVSQTVDRSVVWTDRQQIRKKVVAQLGWNDEFIKCRKEELIFSHLFFDQILPSVASILRRSSRLITFDINRKLAEHYFFNQWLSSVFFQ